MSKKKKGAPKYHVETADGTFQVFTSIRKAVRWVKEDERWTELASEYGLSRAAPNREILDEDGDPVEVDWDADEYKTRSEINEELAATRSARDSARRSVEKAVKDHDDYLHKLIDAGLIPVELLRESMTNWRINYGDSGSRWTTMDRLVDAIPYTATQLTIEFTVTGDGDTPRTAALRKLTERVS